MTPWKQCFVWFPKRIQFLGQDHSEWVWLTTVFQRTIRQGSKFLFAIYEENSSKIKITTQYTRTVFELLKLTDFDENS